MSSACMCHTDNECVWCEQENEINRLREALEFYADKENYKWKRCEKSAVHPNVIGDEGYTARQALEQSP